MNPPDLFRVEAREEEIADTFTLTLTPAEAAAERAFSPGQFNMLYAFGAGEVPISFSGAPEAGGGYRHTVRAVGATTAALQRLQVGDPLGVRGPFGRGWPAADGQPLLLVAGGLGLAPLRPLIYQRLAERPQRPDLQLFYGARQPATLLYRRELDAWGQNFPVVLSVDQAGSHWRGNVGVITSLLASARITQNTRALVCGPEVMMRFSIRTLLGLGLPAEAIYLSMERNMHCAVGHCGHCQWGPEFVCRDGPVFRLADVDTWFYARAV